MAGYMPVVCVRMIAEVKCHLCGRLAGSVERQQSPAAAGVTFRSRASGEAVRVANWAKLRCDACGGTLYLDQVEIVRVRPEPSRDQLWGSDSRRRRSNPDSRN